jgi:hypothetical protein
LLDDFGFGSEAVTANHALVERLLLVLHLHSIKLARVLLHHLHWVRNHLGHHLLGLLHLHLHASLVVHSVHFLKLFKL